MTRAPLTAGEQIPRGALFPALLERERSARDSGALRPIETIASAIDDAGVRFLVRSVSTLAEKSAPTDRAGVNPFLPPDPALMVGGVSPTHIALLSKYPVLAHHLLIVTREFAPHGEILGPDDFAALAWCLAEMDGVGLYNAGQGAGASQPHKHLQLVPLPLGGAPWDIPIEAIFDSWSERGGLLQLLRLPFKHVFALLEPHLFEDHARAAERMQELYAAQMARIAAAPSGAANEPWQTPPYNLLVTRRWMLAVPRAQEKFGSISISALAFAGSLFVRDEAEMRAVRDAGPMSVLKQVAR